MEMRIELEKTNRIYWVVEVQGHREKEKIYQITKEFLPQSCSALRLCRSPPLHRFYPLSTISAVVGRIRTHDFGCLTHRGGGLRLKGPMLLISERDSPYFKYIVNRGGVGTVLSGEVSRLSLSVLLNFVPGAY